MTKIGFTGHQKLEDPRAWSWVRNSLTERLQQVQQPILGITSLAIGSDQLFAKLLLEMGAELHCVLPFEDYQRTFGPDDREEYHSLLAKAQSVKKLTWKVSDETSYMAAGQQVVDLCDRVFTVWDGKPSKGLGGTADVVKYAFDTGRAVTVFNPIDYLIEDFPHKSNLGRF